MIASQGRIPYELAHQDCRLRQRREEIPLYRCTGRVSAEKCDLSVALARGAKEGRRWLVIVLGIELRYLFPEVRDGGGVGPTRLG